MDVFLHQDKYAMGCYTRQVLVIVQGTLDYSAGQALIWKKPTRVEEALLADGESAGRYRARQHVEFRKGLRYA